MLGSIGKQSGESVESVPKKKRKATVGRICRKGFKTGISGVTTHRQPRQCREPKTVKGAQSDPNYISRQLLDCVPVFHKCVSLTHLAMQSTVDLNWH